MHEVHTLRRFGVPSMMVWTVWRFGRNIRLVRENTRRFNAFLPSLETLCPKLGSLAQTSQRADTVTLLVLGRRNRPAILAWRPPSARKAGPRHRRRRQGERELRSPHRSPQVIGYGEAGVERLSPMWGG